ncbi:MAG TPA: hypothetical protein VF116_22310 [Ktedonobacterales bacterium]
MATEGLSARPGVFAQLRHGLMLADAGRPAEDTTGPIVRAWWRVAIRPTPATFRAWGRRAGLVWIVASLSAGSLLIGASAAIDTFHVANVGSLELNPLGRYLVHPAVELVVVRVVANALAVLPITLAVLLALAIVTRPHPGGGLRAQWKALLPPWVLAQPALGLASCVNSIFALGLAAMLQWMHATPPGPLAGLALAFLSFPIGLLWIAPFLGYMLVLLLSAVWSVDLRRGAAMVWLAVGVSLAVGLPVGFAFTFAAHALGIPGPLFGQ